MKNQLGRGLYNILRFFGLKSIRAQLTVSFLLIFLLTLGCAAALYQSARPGASDASAVTGLQLLNERLTTQALLLSAGVAHRNTRDHGIEEFDARLRRLRHDADPALRASLDQVDRAWTAYRAVLRHPSAATRAVSPADVAQRSTDVAGALTRVAAAQQRGATPSVVDWPLTGILMAAGVLVIALLSAAVAVPYVMNELEFLNQRLTSVGTGDLSKLIDVPKEDHEIGRIVVAYNGLLERITKIMRGVTMLALRISTGNENVSANLVETKRGANKQHAELDMVATAMSEMVATVQEVANNTTRAAEAAAQADSEASNGREVTQRAMASIDTLATQLDGAAGAMSALHAGSSEVGQVLSVIHSVAEQTNLLALNAAIEAARAGEQGRGFSVVADEVRTLAQRTQQSTEEIRGIVERLQSQATTAVSAMEHSQTLARASVEQTRNANDALAKIVSAVTTISDMNTQIATAAEEQTKVAESIDQNVVSIAGVAERTNKATEETVEATGEIHAQVEQLRELVGQLKIEVKGVDLQFAKTAHLVWKKNLRDFLDGKGSLSTAQAVSHHDCSLGKWYYGEGMQCYGDVPEMKELESPHAEMHELIKTIISLRDADRQEEAEEEYQKIGPLSKRIVALLDAIEMKSMA
ncbi:MAG: methyl-accepting chemotaxis protein [Gammaproteobacteria bacterium]